MFTTLRRIAWPLMAALLLAGSALAQSSLPTDCWFKLKVAGQGYAVRDDGSAPRKVGGAFTAYLHVTLAVDDGTNSANGPSLPSTVYRFDVWTQVGPDQWQQTDSTTESVEATNGLTYFIPDFGATYQAEDGTSLDTYTTVMIKVKRGKDGGIRSGTFTSLGGEIYDGSLPDGSLIRGGVKITGKLANSNKLPFVP